MEEAAGRSPDLAKCLMPIETASGVFFPCVREHGHAGIHSPGRCSRPVHYEGHEYDCSLLRGHKGQCRTWVEQADGEFDEAARRDWERELQEGRR